jgi:hypothetical protein
LIHSGLSIYPNDWLSFSEIIEVLKDNNFRLADAVNSEVVSAFVSSVELSEP